MTRARDENRNPRLHLAAGLTPGEYSSRSPGPVTPSTPSIDASPPPDRPLDEAVMPLVDHLVELRRRIAISLVAIGAGGVVGFAVSEHVVRLFVGIVPSGAVQFLTFSGPLMLRLRIALVIGILLALPIVLYHLWAFVSPALTPRERQIARPWLPLTILFFLLGEAVALFTLPYAVTFLAGFTIPDVAPLNPSAEAYFGFVFTLFLMFGLVMQFPVVLVLLTKLRVLSIDRLRQARRYVLLGTVIFAVIATPGGDPVSPMVMTAVMYLLYEITILLLARSVSAPTSPADD